MQMPFSRNKYLRTALWALAAVTVLTLTGCGAQRRTVKTPEVVTTHYRNVSARQLPVTISMDSMTYTVYCTMQAVRDSVIVLSYQPLAGMEIVRVEVTEKTIVGVDRTHKRYCVVPLYLPRKGGAWHSLPLKDGETCYRTLQEAVFNENGGTLATEYDGHQLLLQIGSGKRTYGEDFTVRPLKLDEYEEITAHSLLGL